VQGVAMFVGGSAVNQVPARCALRFTLAGEAPDGDPVQSFDCARLLGFHRAWRDVCGALRVPSDADFNPPHTVGNLGRATLADGVAELSFDLRPVAGADIPGALAELGRFAKIECVRTNPPLTTGANTALLESVRAAQSAVGLPQHVGTKATSTEAGLLAEAGVEALVIGPGVSVGNVHKPNEHTSITQLAQARDLYREIARRLCVDVEAAPCSS
jgi:acetylornithine deacetylase/succinyl-diaminopimelate desuccinylase-like protein